MYVSLSSTFCVRILSCASEKRRIFAVLTHSSLLASYGCFLSSIYLSVFPCQLSWIYVCLPFSRMKLSLYLPPSPSPPLPPSPPPFPPSPPPPFPLPLFRSSPGAHVLKQYWLLSGLSQKWFYMKRDVPGSGRQQEISFWAMCADK